MPSFTAALVLDESTCFIDPGDMKIDSARLEGEPGSSYPGLIWVGLRISRIIGVTPEARLLSFMNIAASRFARNEVEEPVSGTIAAAGVTTGTSSSSGPMAAEERSDLPGACRLLGVVFLLSNLGLEG